MLFFNDYYYKLFKKCMYQFAHKILNNNIDCPEILFEIHFNVPSRCIWNGEIHLLSV